MTASTESTKRKLSLLQLAEELGNVSKAMPDHGLPLRHVIRNPPRLSGRRSGRPGGLEARPEIAASEPGGTGDRRADLGAVARVPALRRAAHRQ